MWMRMGGLVEAAILDAARALETRDLELAEKVRKGDRTIDQLEELINEECARTIALRAPVSQDLRVLLTVFRLSGSLERVGDYAKNMAKRTSVLVEMRPIQGSDAATSPDVARGAADAEGHARRLCPARRRTSPRTCASATSTWTRCTTRSSASSSPS